MADGISDIVKSASDAANSLLLDLWRFPSRTIGYSLGTISIMIGGVHKTITYCSCGKQRKIDFYIGGIMRSSWGMTPSDSTIFVGNEFYSMLLKNDIDAWDTLSHECGHTIQAEIFGPLYLPLVVPFTGWSYNFDYFNWAESWATRLGERFITFPDERISD